MRFAVMVACASPTFLYCPPRSNRRSVPPLSAWARGEIAAIPTRPINETSVARIAETIRVLLWESQSGLPVGRGPLMGLEAERSWGPSALEQESQSGLPVGRGPLMGLEAERSWGPSALEQASSRTKPSTVNWGPHGPLVSAGESREERGGRACA
jgi:hypothetical protein